MRLGYFTMPVHPMHRNWAETLKEDREAIILADKLGFYDAFMGEHLTDACENITNSMMFHATLIPETKQIKLATGTSNLSHMHPVLIAVQAAMFDHLSEGRFIFGVSPGALTSDAEALGILDQDRNKMFAEAIDVILAIWERDPPYDIDFPDNRYKVSTARTQALDIGVGIMAKPYQKPRPGDRRHRGGAVLARRGADGQARLPSAVGELPAVEASEVALGELLQGQGRGRRRGRTSRTGGWRARSASPTTTRRRRATAATTRTARIEFYWRADARQDEARQAALRVQERTRSSRTRRSRYDYVMDHCVIHGGVNKVVDQILALREEIGDFGETGLCRHGLGRARAQQALDAIDGRGGHAAGQRGDRQVRRRGLICGTCSS